MKESYHVVRDRWTTRAAEWVQFALARGVRWLTWPIPLWSLTGAFGWLGGRALPLVAGPRKRALANLALIWPEKTEAERLSIARGAAEHFTRLAVEYAHLDRFARSVEIEAAGTEHLVAARDAGKGAILVTAHHGNWEAARLAAKRAGCETGIIFRAFNNRYLTRFTLDLIPVAGEPVLTKGARGMRQLVTHVMRGGFVMILVDQRNSGAPFLDFLGEPAETVTAAADLAHRTGAALIPCRALRNVAERRFEVEFDPAIARAEPREMMQAVNDQLSEWIAEDPDQWLWFHRRWRSTNRSLPHPGEDG